MSKKMTLPKIGVNMTEVIVAEWFVKLGDVVKKGDAIFIGETDKAAQDIFATDSGIVGKLLVEEGDTVEVNEPILLLLDEGEEYIEESENIVFQPKLNENLVEKQEIVTKQLETSKNIQGTHIRISPLAKKMAKERGISLEELVPAQEGKRIVKADVLAYQLVKEQTITLGKSKQLSYDEGDVLDTIPMSNMRKVIASRMSESNLEKPCAALTLTAQADEIIRLRNRYKERNIKVSYNDIIVKIVSKSLTEHRSINSVLNGNNIQLMRHVNVGVAVDSERGLLVPVIKDADTKSIQQISTDFTVKVDAIKNNKINSDDLTGGTFTITNLGMFEIEQFVPIINPPECCILAVGAMKREFIPDESNMPKLATMMKLTLVFDHRIVDGAPAAKFLQSIKHYIECPEMLL